MQMDLEVPVFSDDLPQDHTAAQQHQSSDTVLGESESSAAAPMRRKKRTARILPSDATQELRNKDLLDWNNNYIQNMKEAIKTKVLHRAGIQAKKKAEYWVWGAGIGAVGYRPTGATGPTPFDGFFGDNLFELFTGIDRRARM